MSDLEQIAQDLASDALADDSKLAELIEMLSNADRRSRQNAAGAVNLIAQKNPEILVPQTASIVNALKRPEARTRWECLEALAVLTDFEPKICERALGDADEALFDEDNGAVRLSALRFLCKFGAGTTARSKKVWPLVDEAIQCYHGDPEFKDMLVALVGFSQGKLDASVKAEFAERMKFDALNSKGTLKRRAVEIRDNLGVK